MEIYYKDLLPDAQREVLKLYGIESPEEGNLDIFPLAVIGPSDD